VRRLAVLLPCLVLAAGCGGDDDGFTAQQFVDAVNQRGAALELGPRLPSTRPDAEVYALAVLTPAGEAAAGGTHAGGSLVVTDDDDAGLAEYDRCGRAGVFKCFRADNIVLLLEGRIPADAEAALGAALRTIEEETSG
jgi:hypothetical protein